MMCGCVASFVTKLANIAECDFVSVFQFYNKVGNARVQRENMMFASIKLSWQRQSTIYISILPAL